MKLMEPLETTARAESVDYQTAEADYIRVAGVDEMPVGKARRILVDDIPVAVWHLEDGFYAMEDACPHAGGSLAFGKYAAGIVACPRHGAQFDIRTGRVLSLPALRGVRCYEVRVEDGVVFVSAHPADSSTPSLLSMD